MIELYDFYSGKQDERLKSLTIKRPKTGDKIYTFMFGIKSIYGTHYKTFVGYRKEVIELMESLKDNPDIVDPYLSIREVKDLPAAEETNKTPSNDQFITEKRHFHRIDGKVLNHTWDECPENPKSPNYNNNEVEED